MTELLNPAADAAGALPPERQEEFARLLPGLVQPVDLGEADAESERGDVATEEEVRAMWATFGL